MVKGKSKIGLGFAKKATKLREPSAEESSVLT